MKRTRPTALGLTVLLGLTPALPLAGCAEIPGFASYVISGTPKTKARYTLEERPTLVIVDDPNNVLGDPNFPAVIGANAGFHLKENKQLTPEQVVSQDHLSVLAANMGDRYLATPIDEIGRRLKAEQVIHVQVNAVNLQSDNTYYEPTAELEVKVIDVETGARLFPTDTPDIPGMELATKPGYRLRVEMKRQTVDETRRHAVPMLARSLAERIGLQVAQVFYDHVPPDSPELGT